MIVRRVLRGFDRISEELVEERDISHVEISALQKIFGEKSDEPMFDVYEIDQEKARQLVAVAGISPLSKDLDWFLDADAVR